MAELERIHVKLFAKPETRSDADGYTRVFHRWCRDRTLKEVLVDVIDYSHVHEGPGVMLIAHEANFAMDEGEGRLGLLYAHKRGVDLEPEKLIAHAIDRVLAVSAQLESEPETSSLQFDRNRFRIRFQDRLLAPNNAEGEQRWATLLKSAAEKGLNRTVTVTRLSNDSREPLTFDVTV